MTARTSARDVACPTCGIDAGLPCRSTTTGRSNTDTHKARHDAARAAVQPLEGPTYAELCAGYGGLGMGVQAVLGGRLDWYAEWDDAPSAIMAHHHPDAHNYRDVTAIDWHNVPRVDIVTAGFPCQPFSHAGKRLGANDERHLWPHLAEGIAILRPQLVVLENVRGLASGQGEPDTDEIVALDARRQHIDRALVVIERRRRKAKREGKTFHIRQHTDDGHRLMVERRQVVARAKRARAELARALATVLGDLADLGYDAQWYGLRASDVGAAHERFRFFVYAWPADAPSDPRWIGYGPTAIRHTAGIGVEGIGPRRVEVSPAHAGQGLPLCSGADAPDGVVAWNEYELGVRRWESRTRPAPAPTELTGGRRRLSARFAEWLMGLPAGHVTDPAIGLSYNAQLEALGNGVVPQQCAAATAVFVDDMRAERTTAAATA